MLKLTLLSKAFTLLLVSSTLISPKRIFMFETSSSRLFSICSKLCPYILAALKGQPFSLVATPSGVLGHLSRLFFTPSLSSSVSSWFSEHPKASTFSPTGVSLQRSIPLGTPSRSSSNCDSAQPLSSTTSSNGVAGQTSLSLGIPSKSKSLSRWLVEQPNSSTSSPKGVSWQRSISLGTPSKSKSFSFWLKEHPNSSTLSPMGVLGQRSRSSLILS